MDIQSVHNFQYGLDTRRSELSQRVGTLKRCENAHINQGGEVEKRQAFVISANDFADNTFGLESTGGGLVTFGSDAAPSSPLPAGVTYTRLQHPFVLDGGAYSSPQHDMTSIVFSTTFSGNVFAIAEFDHNDRYAYYAGEIVEQYKNGVVRASGTSLAEIASALAAEVNALGGGWSAEANVDIHGEALNGSVIMYSPHGIYFEVDPEAHFGGEISDSFVERDGPGTPGVAARASFAVTYGAGGHYTVTAPANADGSGTANLATSILAITDDDTTAEAIKDAINASTATTGYIATRTDNVIFVYAPIEWGDVTFNLTATADGVGGSAVGSPGTEVPEFAVYTEPASVAKTVLSSSASAVCKSDALTVVAVGGSSPYTFEWMQTDALGNELTSHADRVAIYVPLTSQTVRFVSGMIPTGTSVEGYFVCTVTDNIGQEINTKVIRVTLTVQAV